jgi:hypothetical protein
VVNAALIFDLLGFPIAPLGDGDLVVLGQRDQLRRVPLRATEHHVIDAARDQSTAPWLLTRSELFLLSAGGDRELSFPITAFGQGGGAGAVLSMLEAHAPSACGERRVFALNTARGAYVLELDGGTLNMLNDEPIDFVACASAAQHGGVALLGSSRRAPDSSGALQPGHPAIVQVEAGAHRARARAPLALAPIGPQVIDKLMAAPHGLSRNLAAQAVPEAIVAAAGDRFLVGLTVLPDRLDAGDELAPRMMNNEMIGLALVCAQGEVIDVVLHTACLGTWRDRVLMISNRGRGGRLDQLSTLALEAGCASFAGMTKVRVVGAPSDPGSLVCHRFQPRHHASIGSFGMARVSEPDRAERAAVLVDRGDQRWDVIGDEQDGPLPLAPPAASTAR